MHQPPGLAGHIARLIVPCAWHARMLHVCMWLFVSDSAGSVAGFSADSVRSLLCIHMQRCAYCHCTPQVYHYSMAVLCTVPHFLTACVLRQVLPCEVSFSQQGLK